jgi:predicted dehydrogenase
VRDHVRPVHAAIVGLGVGEHHIAGYRAHPAAEVVAICDFDEQRLAEVAARHPELRTAADSRDILDDPDIDAVSICSYDHFHFEQVRDALEAGKHVFVEKPLCLHAHEARELARLIRDRPELRLSSNLPLRLSPRFHALREEIAAGELGRLYYVEGDYDYGRLWKITEGWRGDLEYYSVVLGGAVHMIDLLLWLTGERVTEVVGAAGNRIVSEGTKFAYDDLVVAMLRFESGLVAKVGANFGCVHPHYHALKVFGTDGTFINGLPHGTRWSRGPDGPTATPADAAYPGVAKGDLIHSFVESIVSGRPPAVTTEDVFATIAVCFAIERAKETKAPVPVESLL